MPDVSVNGVTLHYEDRGSGPPIIFQHGYTSAGDAWDGVVERLGTTYRCITIDSRGAGDSAHPGSDYTVDQLALDVLGIADALGIERFAYVGHSFGGGIGMRLGLSAPERLDRMVWVAPIGADGFEVDPAYASALEEQHRNPDPERMIAERLAGGARPERASREATAHRVDRALSVDQAYLVEAGASMRELRIRDQLHRIETPTLMVAGAADGLLADNLTDFALLPHATLHVFSRVGHGVASEVPSALARVIADFMEHGVVRAETIAARAAAALRPTSE